MLYRILKRNYIWTIGTITLVYDIRSYNSRNAHIFFLKKKFTDCHKHITNMCLWKILINLHNKI